MTEPLPTEVDLIVIGTGLTESIVAAAASRVGKTVLHLDTNEYYGGYWTSFNLTALINYANRCNDKTDEKSLDNSKIFNVKVEWHLCENEKIENVEIGEETPIVETDDWTKDKVLKEFRKFNIDITPKLLFARGSLVELLISSNICRYSEFRAVDHVITLIDGTLKSVPCSRADVFSSKEINVVEKRLLMKLLTTCLSYDENNEDFKKYEDKPFIDYLNENNLTPKLIHYIIYSITMNNKAIIFQDGIENTKKFLISLGRYGNTPFLFPMYGCGELPQCFCRLCSVFGGVYCLRRSIEDIIIDDKQFKRIKCGEQKIDSKELIIGSGITNNLLQNNIVNDKEQLSINQKKCGELSRGIFITKTPLGDEELNKGGGGVTLLKIPNDDDKNNKTNGAFIIQLSHYSGTCPKGLYLFHIIAEKKIDAETDLKPYLQKLFKSNESDDYNIPGLIWSMYFNIPACKKCRNPNGLELNGINFCCGPFFELDYDKTIEQAKEIFKKMYVDEEFLPRAPDPEEIIIGEDDDDNETAIEADENIKSDNIDQEVIEEDCVEKGTELSEDNII